MNNFLISSLGIASGSVIGSMANFLRDKSLHSKDMDTCNYNSFSRNKTLQFINLLREVFPTALLFEIISRPADIYEVYHNRTEEELGILGFFKTDFTRNCKRITLNELHNLSVGKIADLARHFLKNTAFFTNNEIYISGHILKASRNILGIINILDHSEKHHGPWAKTAIKTLVVASGIADAIWIYNTSANCHSIIEVALGFGLFIGSHYSLKALESGVSKTASATYNLLFKKKPE